MTWKKNIQIQQAGLNPQGKTAFFYFYNMEWEQSKDTWGLAMWEAVMAMNN